MMDWLNEIKARHLSLPNDLVIKEFELKHIPIERKNVNTGPFCVRVDVYSASDPKKKPLFHIHVTKEDPDFNPKWREVLEYFIQLHNDMGRLIKTLEEQI